MTSIILLVCTIVSFYVGYIMLYDAYFKPMANKEPANLNQLEYIRGISLILFGFIMGYGFFRSLYS